MNVKKFIDLHVHIGPEVLPRKFTTQEIIREEAGKIKGLALKNHTYSTAPLIKSQEESGLILISSVTLNNYVGGLNPDAIYASAKLSDRPIIVWFPTINAENFLKRSQYEIPPEWVSPGFKSRLSGEVKGIKVTNKDKLTEEAKSVLKAIKENNCILATGHISWKESETLVKEAVKLGIKKIIITHPIYPLIDMPIKIQKELAGYEGVYIEQAYTMYLTDKIPIKRIAQQIREIGAAKCIISSDMGQVKNPSPSEAMREFATLLMRQGISEEEIRVMGERNPLRLIS